MRTSLIAILLVSTSAWASEWVNGYTRSDGTYVPGHYRSSPNNTKIDNYSTRGNTNPYTGQRGYVEPYRIPTPTYQQREYRAPRYDTQPNPYLQSNPYLQQQPAPTYREYKFY